MDLSDEMIHDLNILSDWLSVDDFYESQNGHHDILILTGHAIIPNIFGALFFASQVDITVLLSGGVGHSTSLLRAAIKELPFITIDDIDTKCEAEILSIIATEIFHIPEEKILIEDCSTNCGENARFSGDLLIEKNFDVKAALLVQDPLMQRRTFESFIYNWQHKDIDCQFTNWPVFKPRLLMTPVGLKIIGGQLPGQWDVKRYISMILGEMKRLYDDIYGYGPNGSGFIGHVNIPDKIVSAWQRLRVEPDIVGITR